MMTKLFQVRLALLVGAIVLVAGGMFWGVQHSWRRVADLERKLTSSQLEGFRLAEDFDGRLRSVNNSILRFAARREPPVWDEFVRSGSNLDRWISQYDPRENPKSILATERESQLLHQLNTGFDDYLLAANRLRTNGQGGTMSIEAYRQVTALQDRAQQLLEINARLAQAHRESEQQFVLDANRSLENFRAFLLGSVAVTLALVGALGVVIYLDQIAPLRIKLVQSQEVLAKQEKLATLGTLAAGIAHEVRNPLTSVKARLYTLEKHLASPALARVDAQVISGEITRLEGIVQAVLNFARPSEPVMKTVCVSSLLQEVVALMAPSLERQQVRVRLEPGPEHWVCVDAGHLKQVLINLVRNAAEAITGEGVVTLRSRAGRAAFPGRDAEAVVIEVSDTGCGISPEVEKRLFDPFFSTKETGTGLGLSIAARIIEKHGGSLQYQTRVGHGTTFGIVMPRAAEPRIEAAANTAPPA